MDQLKGLRVAVIAADGFEESELTEPVKALNEAGAEISIVSLKKGPIQAFKHHDKSITINADMSVEDLSADEFDAVMLPGGALNADQLRVNGNVKSFLKSIDQLRKPMAVICHAPWELISAGVARGRKLTAYHTIKDDLVNAGANFVDSEVVVDGNIVTSRQPSDLPAFNREMIRLFADSRAKAAA